MTNLSADKHLRSRLLGRLLVVLFVFLVWGGLITWRLVHLQALDSFQYKLKAEVQQQGFVELGARRGDILDRRLEELAISVRADSIYAHPAQVEDPDAAAKALAPLLEVPEQVIRVKLAEKSSFVYLKRKAGAAVAQKVRELKLTGIGTQEDTARVYPSGTLAGHVLGFVGTDNDGLAGLEYSYGRDLSGTKARIDLRVDARRTSYQANDPAVATEGNTLILTLDRSIQHTAETVLRKTIEETGAVNGTAVVMDPATGEILAMASVPDFDPNRFSEAPAAALRNRAILDLYEPGSTFKVMTLAALLSEGLAEPDEVVDCSAGSARIAGKVYKEATRNYGLLTVREVLAKSSNIGTVKLALRLGNDRLYENVRRFGFGSPTGIDLPGEEAGILRPPSNWSKISIGAISIGQEIGVTPLQMVRALAAVANGGLLVQPYLVSQVLTPDGDLVYEASPCTERVLDPQISALLRSMLSSVVEAGTGSKAALRGYSSGGKTGTAQKIVDGRYSRTRYVASYAGFAPLDRPRLVTLVVINEPKGVHYGGHVAAPAFKEIMERSLLYLGVPQDQPVEVEFPRNLAGMGRNSRPAPGDTEEALLSPTQLQETMQALLDDALDDPSTPPTPGASVTVEVGGEPLPDFSGRSLRDVVRECARLGIRLKISGTGLAVAQRPQAGRGISRNMVCEVFFAPSDKVTHATSKLALGDSGGSGGGRGLRR